MSESKSLPSEFGGPRPPDQPWDIPGRQPQVRGSNPRGMRDSEFQADLERRRHRIVPADRGGAGDE